MRIRTPALGQARDPRRGTVIVAVLVVVVLLSLAAYKYADLMSAEHRVAHTFVRAAQAQGLAWSGVNYAAVALSTSDNVTNYLGGNPFNSTTGFQDHGVQGGSDGSQAGTFSIVSGGDPDNQGSGGTTCFGAICEAGRININAVMKLDPSGNTLYNLLMQLPNMTDDIANAIVDWLDPDDTPRSNGAESDYYAGLTPPYQAKNNYLDSLDELLLVRGVTPQLLYGNDRNRNGMIDSDENDSSGLGTGWSGYLTIYSRELNVDSTGNPRVNVTDSNLQNLYTNLSAALTADMTNFIMLYCLYGSSPAPPANTQTSPASGFDPASLDLTTQKAKGKIASLYDLINTYVMVPAPMNSPPKTPATYYASPLNDQSQLATLLPTLLDKCTTSKGQYFWGRVNVNTAPQAVLNALGILSPTVNQTPGAAAASSSSSSSSSSPSAGTASNPYLTATDIQNIIAKRPQIYTGSTLDPTFQSPAWLMTQAGLSPGTMKKIEQYITTRSQVYRVQSVGSLGTGAFARVEAVIDTNGGQPRILNWRDLSELGKGFNWQSNNAGN